MCGNTCERLWFVFFVLVMFCATSLHGATLPLSPNDERQNPCAPDDLLCEQIFAVKKDALGLMDEIFENFPDIFDDGVEDTAGQDGGAVQRLTPPTEDEHEPAMTQEPTGGSATEEDLSGKLGTTVLSDADWITLAEYEEVTTVVYDKLESDVDGSTSGSRGHDGKPSGAPVTERAEVADGKHPVTSPAEIVEDIESDVVTTRIVEEEVVTEYVTEKADNVGGEIAGTTVGVGDLTSAAPSTSEPSPTTTESVTTASTTTLGTTRQPPTTLPPLPRDCDEIWQRGNRATGVYDVYPEKSRRGIKVFCDLQDPVGGWTVIQRRVDGSVNFYQSYFDYLMGFGDVNQEFYLGNEKIHQLSDQKDYELRIILFDFEGESRYAHYRLFRVGDYASDYELTVRGYIGNAGNSLGYHSRGRFSTFDRDNDANPAENCACSYASGWWFQKCDVKSNLNGRYLRGNHSDDGEGITWAKWKGLNYSLKYTEMKIRPIKL